MAPTDTKIKNLKAEQRPYKKADFNGLYVLVNPSGSKLWRFKYRFNNNERLIAFGKYPDISLQQARQLRDEARSQLAQGIDPSEHRKQRIALVAEQTANSFEKIASQYLDKIKAEGRADVTMRKNSSFIAMANKDFGKKSITEISSRDILKTLKKIEAKGNYETAHRVRSTVGAVFRYAIANGLVENDPTIALRDALYPLIIKHGKPEHIRSDNGPEFVSELFQTWLKRVGIKPIHIYPGSPWENGYNERFNGTLRNEILNANWFQTTHQAQATINCWIKEYNHIRPHQGLGMRPPIPETTTLKLAQSKGA